MPATMYYDQDADLGLLKGKTVAVIGYGSQGHAQAQNLRDSGITVVVGQRPGSANHDLAVKDGFKPVSAAEAAEGEHQHPADQHRPPPDPVGQRPERQLGRREAGHEQAER